MKTINSSTPTLRTFLLSLVLSVSFGLSATASAQQTNDNASQNQRPDMAPILPFVDVDTVKRLDPDNLPATSQTNAQFAEIDRMQQEMALAEQERLAQEMYNERLLSEQINKPGLQFMQQAIDMYKPSMDIQVKPKESIVIPVGEGLLNTIATNYKEVRAKTSDASTVIETDGGMIYISGIVSMPVGLVIYDAGVIESMVTITLIPISAPPVIVDLDVEMTSSMRAKSAKHIKQLELDEAMRTAQTDKNATRSNEHVQRIVDILVPIAQQDVPPGFTLTSDIPKDMLHPCKMAIPHITGQRLLGSQEIVDIVIARNTTDRVYQVREEMCISDEIAVGIFKTAYLQPGQEVEIYILRNKHKATSPTNTNKRPRLTFGE